MNTYQYSVTLVVDVEAHSKDDAMELLSDTFGPGEDCGVDIKQFEAVDVSRVG